MLARKHCFKSDESIYLVALTIKQIEIIETSPPLHTSPPPETPASNALRMLVFILMVCLSGMVTSVIEVRGLSYNS